VLRWQARPTVAGFYDFRARLWSPELGTFLQPDQHVYLTRGGTLWSWPGNNPFRWRDPSGRFGYDDFESWMMAHGEDLALGVAAVSVAPIAIYAAGAAAAGAELGVAALIARLGGSALPAARLAGAGIGAVAGGAKGCGDAEAGISGAQPIAVGLSRSGSHRPGLVGRFADELGATTYWDLYPGALPSNAEIVSRMATQFAHRPIVVNLSGLQQVEQLGVNAGLRVIVSESAKTVTEAEIATVLSNPSFFGRAQFFLNGAEVSVNRGVVLAP
jgi:RHS repeat-associated protein